MSAGAPTTFVEAVAYVRAGTQANAPVVRSMRLRVGTSWPRGDGYGRPG